jgi:hypothetical protein
MYKKILLGVASALASILLASIGSAENAPQLHKGPWPIRHGRNYQPTESELKALPPRSIYEGARDMARGSQSRGRDAPIAPLRKKIEMLFAHLKRILKLDRLRLRGPNGAWDEFILAATAQNLRKMAKLIPKTFVPHRKVNCGHRRTGQRVAIRGSSGGRVAVFPTRA